MTDSSIEKYYSENESTEEFDELNTEITKVLSNMSNLKMEDHTSESQQNSQETFYEVSARGFQSPSFPIIKKPLRYLSVKSNSSNKFDSKNGVDKNKIIFDLIINGKDKRTTIMIKHIPNKYTLKMLTEEINVKFKNTYDVFYLPIDYTNNCNLGFAFINFINPFYIIYFYETFKGKRWKKFLSEKRCDLAYAKIQGKKSLERHFEKGTVLNSQPADKKPLILNVSQPYPKILLPIEHKEHFIQCRPDVKITQKLINGKKLISFSI